MKRPNEKHLLLVVRSNTLNLLDIFLLVVLGDGNVSAARLQLVFLVLAECLVVNTEHVVYHIRYVVVSVHRSTPTVFDDTARMYHS